MPSKITPIEPASQAPSCLACCRIRYTMSPSPYGPKRQRMHGAVRLVLVVWRAVPWGQLQCSASLGERCECNKPSRAFVSVNGSPAGLPKTPWTFAHCSNVSSCGIGDSRGHTGCVGDARKRNLSLLTRIHVIVGVLAALVLAAVASTYVLSQQTVNVLSHLENLSRPAETSTSELIKAYDAQSDNVRAFLPTGNQAFLQLDTSAQTEASQVQGTLRQQLAGDPASTRALTEVNNAAAAWRNNFANPEIYAVLSGTSSPGQLPQVSPPFDTPGARSFQALQGRLTDLQRLIQQNADRETAQVGATRTITEWLTAAVGLLAVGLVVTSVFFLRHSLTRPLTQLVADVSDVSRGDLSRPVRSSGPPELATTAEAVERMRVHILEKADAAIHAQQQLARLEESERIAYGLHDQVIQRLVATGMMLESTARQHPTVARDLSASTAAIDRTIQDLRTVIFGLTSGESRAGLRQQILEILRDSEPRLGFPVHVEFRGVIEPWVTDAVAEEVIPTVQECLSNIARHAHASRAELLLTATEEELILRITDDGVGVDPDHRPTGLGLTNILGRAQRLGGTCTVNPIQPHGTIVDWRIPLPATNDA
jgi:signal transduction histidine kinase